MRTATSISVSLEAPLSLTSRPGYRPDIDGLRGIAVLGVIGFHIDVLRGGSAGVDIFFVISGFLISGIILRSLADGTFSYFDFYTRRLRRILPAFIIVLLSTWAIAWFVLLPDEFKTFGESVLMASGFAHNFYIYHWASRPLTPEDNFSHSMLGHIWSLSVEEQFYLIWPLCLVGLWKFRRRLTLIAEILIAFSFVMCAVATLNDPPASYFLTWDRLWELTAGGWLAFEQNTSSKTSELFESGSMMKVLRRYSEIVRNIFGSVGLIILFASLAGLSTSAYIPGSWALAPTVGTILLIAAGPSSWVGQVIGATPMVFVGLISYPLYLWHYPLLWTGRILAGRQTLTHMSTLLIIGVIFALAIATYRYIELPVRSMRAAGAARILCLLLAFCGALGLMTRVMYIRPRLDTPELKEFVIAANENWILGSRKNQWDTGGENAVLIGGTTRRVLYIGDNNMQLYYRRITKILADHPGDGRGAIFLTKEWCAPGALSMVEFPSELNEECKKLIHGALAYVHDKSVDTVVIAACWYVYFVDFVDLDRVGTVAPLRAGTDRALAELENFIEQFSREGKQVYIVLNTPIGPPFDPHLMVRRSALHAAANSIPPKRSEVERALAGIDGKLINLAREVGANVIDPKESLCREQVCPVVSATGAPLYRDMFDLRPSVAEAMAIYVDRTLTGSASGGGFVH